MGRKLIEIKKIEDRVAKEYAFAQRKRGLIKKTIELGILCELDISLTIYDPQKKILIEYNTREFTHERIKALRKSDLSQHQVFYDEDLEALNRKNITMMQFEKIAGAKKIK